MKGNRPVYLLLGGVVVIAVALWLARGAFTGTSSPRTATGTNRPAARTNAPALAATKPTPPPAARPNPAPAPAAARTNTAAKSALAKAGATTNAIVSTPGTNAPSALSGVWDAVKKFPPSYYPTIGFGILGLIALVILLKSKSAAGKAKPGALAVKKRVVKGGAVHCCNVLEEAAGTRSLWQFNARGTGFALSREYPLGNAEAPPRGAVTKDWRSLWQSKLNVAWLPPEQVFMRVVHLPASDPDETLSMIELQLEKLSPMPVAQVVWSLHPLPQAEMGMQSLLVVVVSRAIVEQFLGRLEGEGFLADRLELPFIDQLQARPVAGNGAWIYPLVSAPGKHTALVAWWYGGVLRDLAFLAMPAENQAQSVREQLLQMIWAGELEGWLTAPPAWRLVGDAPALEAWHPPLREALEQDIPVEPPVPRPELAALTAKRAAHSSAQPNLLPPEYAARYHQLFVDRLWMGALGGAVGIYLVVVAVYFIAVQVALFRTREVEKEVVRIGPTYTNAMQLKAQYQVLKDRQELKYAALDCWRTVADLLPEDMSLDSFTFADGKRLTLQGTAPMGQVQPLYQFESAMRKTMVSGQLLFEPLKGETITYHTAPGGSSIGWSLVLELKRSEVQ